MRCWSFFFFQAEDGIRDKLVTGVQTCALPIWQQRGSARRLARCTAAHFLAAAARYADGVDVACVAALLDPLALLAVGAADRSEERRVGKECRSRWSPYH